MASLFLTSLEVPPSRWHPTCPHPTPIFHTTFSLPWLISPPLPSSPGTQCLHTASAQ